MGINSNITPSLQHRHVATFCDNISATTWAHKMRNSRSIIAGHLLRILGLRVHATGASPLTPLYIPGEENEIADIISRAFKHGKFFKAHTNLLPYFQQHFPLTQGESWNVFQLPSALISRITSCLRGGQLALASLLRLPTRGKNTGRNGPTLPQPAVSPHPSPTWNHSSATSSSAPLLTRSGKGLLDVNVKCRFKQSRRRWRPYPRPSNWLENPAPSTGMQMKTTTSPLNAWWKDNADKTHPPSHNSRSQSQLPTTATKPI